jgi:hypothetical protein
MTARPNRWNGRYAIMDRRLVLRALDAALPSLAGRAEPLVLEVVIEPTASQG